MAEKIEYLLGFDVGGTKCAAVLGRREGERLVIVDKRVFATAEQPEPERCIGRYVEEMRGLLARHGVNSCSGVGISCGGPLDAERGIVLSPPNGTQFSNVNGSIAPPDKSSICAESFPAFASAFTKK